MRSWDSGSRRSSEAPSKDMRPCYSETSPASSCCRCHRWEGPWDRRLQDIIVVINDEYCWFVCKWLLVAINLYIEIFSSEKLGRTWMETAARAVNVHAHLHALSYSICWEYLLICRRGLAPLTIADRPERGQTAIYGPELERGEAKPELHARERTKKVMK